MKEIYNTLRKKQGMLTALLLGSFMLLATMANAQTVTTDKPDYAPGEIVTISGSGWLAGETVNMVLNHMIFDHPTEYITTVADASGNISDNSYIIDVWDVGELYKLTATGETSGTATTTFTDATDAASGEGNVTIDPINVCQPGPYTYTISFLGDNGRDWNNGSVATFTLPKILLTTIVVNEVGDPVDVINTAVI
ncbi:MAG: hypothetical protein HQ522_01355 [Bacteroidetes bacterium]|nr:hypothetical protein [Bacteroidota bacterium]